MNVYIVTAGTYSSYHIVDVFLTKEDAETFVEKLKNRLGDLYEYSDHVGVEEYQVSCLHDNVLTRWPNNEAYSIYYDCTDGRIWNIQTVSIGDIIDRRVATVFEQETWTDYKGHTNYGICLPTNVCDRNEDTDELKNDEKLLKIVRDRWAMYKAAQEMCGEAKRVTTD